MTKNVGPSRFSATKPAGIIPRENLIIGTHPWLFNKDCVGGYIPLNHVTSQSFSTTYHNMEIGAIDIVLMMTVWKVNAGVSGSSRHDLTRR